MPTAIWGESEPLSDDSYPLSLLKQLLGQMMERFSAQGACLALYDEHIRQMVIRLHLRAPATAGTPGTPGPTAASPLSGASLGQAGTDIDQVETIPFGRRKTPGLPGPATPTPSTGNMRRLTRPLSSLERLADSSPAALFPLGEAYSPGLGLIGITWRKGEPMIFRRDEPAQSAGEVPPFVSSASPFGAATDSQSTQTTLPGQSDTLPNWYLSLPILGPPLPASQSGHTRAQVGHPTYQILGVIVLYQTMPAPGFQQNQLEEALLFTERIALYIQNEQLRRVQAAMHSDIQRLQQISMTFPSNVILSRLVEDVYQFVMDVVPASSMLITLYDRDTKKMYDIFAVSYGQRILGPSDHPVVSDPASRPLWWKVAQEEQRTLLLSTSEADSDTFERYDELLRGTWGDQTGLASFLLLPMKMFTRVTGSLSIASKLPGAFTQEKVLVLETMVQLITVGIENSRLYDRSRRLLRKAQQHEESLAAMNSALLTISTVLNLGELLQKFVEMAATLVQAELSTFFQLSADGQELVAQAVHDHTGKWRKTRGITTQATSEEQHSDLIEMIRLPYQQSLIAKLVEGPFFYLDSTMVDELAEQSSEGGAFFLRETLARKKLLMIPVRYQTELIGILAVQTLSREHTFRPEDVSTLLAISSQTASAIRNAQLFEQISMANAELRRMDRLKDEFIVTASHELRTPLSAISGYASLIKRQGLRITPQNALRYATKIGEATQQLIALVQNMVEASKLGTVERKMELKPGPVQLSAAMEIAMAMVSVNIEQKIAVEVDAGLWVYCDGMYLRQVLTNLLDNAAKYSPPTGQIIVNATATTLSQLPEQQIDYQQLVNEDDQDVVLVRVCDEGDGIPLEDQERIFDKFVRASRSLTTPIRGSGLGLYICRRYIEAMGGKLWLEMSIPGEGSIFSFYLPRIEAPILLETDEPAFEPEYEQQHEPEHETA